MRFLDKCGFVRGREAPVELTWRQYEPAHCQAHVRFMPETTSSTRRLLPYAGIVAAILGIIWFSTTQMRHADREIRGVVQAVTESSQIGADGHPMRTALVRLDDGTLIQAHIATAAEVHSDQKAKVLMYEQVFSAARSYELVGVEGAK